MAGTSSIGFDLHWEYPAARDGSPAFASIGNMVDGSPPEPMKTTFEDKYLNQSDRWVRKIGGFVDGGKINFRLSYAKSLYTKLLAATLDPLYYDFKAVFPDTSYATFQALVTKVSTPMSADGDRVISDVGLDVHGAVTFTEAA